MKAVDMSEERKLDLHHHSNFTVVEVNISQIHAGDVVLHGGHLRTLCPKDIKLGGLLGKSIWGDSYRSGSIPVKRALFGKCNERFKETHKCT